MRRNAVETAQDVRRSEWPWFLGWFGVGGCLALGLCALLTVGAALVAVAAAAAVLLLRQGHRNAVAGGLTGVALPLFYLAYLNRGGPGTVCQTTAGGQTCTDEYAPVPFLVAGVLFCVAGFLLFRLLRSRQA